MKNSAGYPSHRIWLMILIMSAVIAVTLFSTLYLLYRAAIEEHKNHLALTAESLSHLISSVFQFDQQYSQDDVEGGAQEASLSQVRLALTRMSAFGRTGDIVLGKKEANQIVIVQQFRNSEVEGVRKIPVDSELAEPMRRALNGLVGAMAGLDYRGHTVLAAYIPIHGAEFGLVVKRDITEVWENYITAGLMAILIAFIGSALGSYLHFRISYPLIRAVAVSEEKYRGIFEMVPVSVWEEDWTETLRVIQPLREMDIDDYQAYFNAHPDLVAAALKAITIEDINQETLEMFDANSKQELMGSLETVFATEDTLPGFISELAALCQRRPNYTTEMKLNTVHGDVIHTLLQMTFPSDESQSGRVLVSLMDITKLKDKERELRASEKRFRNYFEHSLIGMAITSPEKGWIDANPRLTEILQYSKDELSQKNWAEMTHPDDLQADIEQFNRLITGEIAEYNMEKRFIRKDGEYVFTNLYVTCVRKDSHEIDYVIAHLEDITNQKKAEKKVHELNRHLEKRVALRTRQLETSNQELESFSYSVSHDLRAPLRHMSGFLDLLERQCDGSLDEKSTRYLGLVKESSRKMGQLIDDLLQFSRMGRVELKNTKVDMNRLIEAIRFEFSMDNANRIVEWAVKPMRETLGDARLLNVVFTNLIENALKYTQKCERAVIEIGEIDEDENYQTIYIKDNGVGFDMAYYEKLFGVFQRLHSDADYQGTGIGLATVKRIVAKHQGKIWADSKPNEGACFYVSLPKLQEEEEEDDDR